MGERKISGGTAGMLIATAFFFDVLNIAADFISFGLLGIFVDAFAVIVLSLWFSHLGVSLWSSRNVGRTLLAMVLDAFPGTDLTFPWTWQVTYTVLTERVSESVVKTITKPQRSRTNSGWRI
jgi:hypothetical protein